MQHITNGEIMLSKVHNILKNVQVLIVEDNQPLLDMMKILISPYVKNIYTADNGEQGLSEFHLHEINLIISDIHMTRMSGIHMMKEIRKFDPYVPVIFITAYDSDENMLSSIALKSRHFLKKPFDKDQLLISMVMAVAQDTFDINMLQMLHGFSYQIETKCLFHEGNEVELTRTEQRLLYLLLMHRNRTVSFDMIESYSWQDKGASADTIRNYINRLRNKIYPDLIKNVQGIGYQLTLL